MFSWTTPIFYECSVTITARFAKGNERLSKTREMKMKNVLLATTFAVLGFFGTNVFCAAMFVGPKLSVDRQIDLVLQRGFTGAAFGLAIAVGIALRPQIAAKASVKETQQTK